MGLGSEMVLIARPWLPVVLSVAGFRMEIRGRYLAETIGEFEPTWQCVFLGNEHNGEEFFNGSNCVV